MIERRRYGDIGEEGGKGRGEVAPRGEGSACMLNFESVPTANLGLESMCLVRRTHKHLHALPGTEEREATPMAQTSIMPHLRLCMSFSVPLCTPLCQPTVHEDKNRMSTSHPTTKGPGFAPSASGGGWAMGNGIRWRIGFPLTIPSQQPTSPSTVI